MAAEICITSFASGTSVCLAGDQLDSGNALVSGHSANWELVAIAATSVANVAHAYGTSFFNKGDTVLTANAAVTANPSFFTTSGAATLALRQERLGGHR